MAQPHALQVTEAVVLRLADSGETDRVVTLLTAAQGKVSALAKAAKRSRKRFGAALDPFGYGEATLRRGRNPELPILESFYCPRGFPHLSQELGRYGHGCYALELCSELCPPHEPEPVVLATLVELLALLDRLPLPEKPRPEPLRAFELRLLEAVGLGLSLSRCAACGTELPAGPEGGSGRPVPFDVDRGGVLCIPCLGAARHVRAEARPLQPAVREALLQLGKLSPTEALAVRLAPEIQSACRDLLLGFLRHHLGRNLRAVEFIARLNLQR